VNLRGIATEILGIDPSQADGLIELRRGARTIGLFATPPDVGHGFGGGRQVLVKIYKGDGGTSGNEQYRTYHGSHFQRVPALIENPYIQKSLAAGIYRRGGSMHPYAVLEYIPGTELADLIEEAKMDFPAVCRTIEKILLEIWIPIWGAGLRFKDCHPGNFILGADGHVYMIDTEQIRKDVAEHLLTPAIWKQRDRHEELGAQRLPGLITRLIRAARPDCKKGAVDREVRRLLAEVGLTELLKQLGRGKRTGAADEAIGLLIDKMRRYWGRDPIA
jgi:hypothetical protein